ncbi:MAG: NADH-quinone oxidoreductase subunit M [Sporichthyaceae bacterium]|nr:NADH-quinone oxidoreductase subunit M [Sporichthyaceae bacterium]
MTDFPWLTVLGAVPLFGAVAVMLTSKERPELAKRAALVASLVTAGLAIAMATQFKTGAVGYQFVEKHQWIPEFGVNYALGVDGIALVLIALATILVPIVILASWHDADPLAPGGAHAVRAAGDPPPRRPVRTFFALILILETMMIGVFAATDIFLFYVFFEAMLIPMYFLIGSFGGPRRSYAAVKFLLYSLFGGLLMLAAVIGLYAVARNQLGSENATFDLPTLAAAIKDGTLVIDPVVEKLLFAGFFIAFAIKAPLVPFHTWLPDAAAEATPGSAVLLVGVLDKVGTFGMLRYCLLLFPAASQFFTPLVIVLAVVGILYGALLAIGQTDIKRLIAYTSISHFGFIALGVFALTTQAQSGSTLYMVNHGFSTAALFLIAGFLIARGGSRLISDYGGVQSVAPILAGTFLVAGLSALSLPGLSSFVSEFLVLVGTFPKYQVAAVLATLGVILAAIYVLWLYQRAMNGPVAGRARGISDLNRREVWAVVPLLAVIVALGVYPKPVLDVINPAVTRTLEHVEVTDPAPTVNTSASTEGTQP